MREFALVLGILGAISFVIGILTAAAVIPEFGSTFTWMFWFVMSAVMFLSSIAAAVVAPRQG